VEMPLNFEARRSDLLKQLGAVVGVLEHRNTIPIVQNVVLIAEGESSVRIVGTDLESWMTATIPASVTELGKRLLPGRKLLEIVKNAPGDEISFREDREERLVIQCGSSRFRLFSPSAENFPEHPACGEVRFGFPAEMLMGIFKWVGLSMTTEETRFQLNGAQMEISPEGVKFVSTDGHRLSVGEGKIEGSDVPGDEGKILIPRKTIQEVAKMAAEVRGEQVMVHWDKFHIWFEIPNRRLVSPLLTGNFPDYRKVIPKSATKKIVVERLALISALRRVGIISDQVSRSIQVSIEKDKITLTAIAQETGEVVESLPAKYQGPEIGLTLNWRYLIEFLEQMATEEIRFYAKDQQTAILLRPEGETGPFESFGVIMTMRSA
jgi:DNA polymerase III subunit beta